MRREVIVTIFCAARMSGLELHFAAGDNEFARERQVMDFRDLDGILLFGRHIFSGHGLELLLHVATAVAGVDGRVFLFAEFVDDGGVVRSKVDEHGQLHERPEVEYGGECYDQCDAHGAKVQQTCDWMSMEKVRFVSELGAPQFSDSRQVSACG